MGFPSSTVKMNCFAVLAVLLCCTGFVTSSLIEGLLPNGNFEQDPNPSYMEGTNILNPNAIPEWETSGFVEYIKSGQKQDDMLLVVPEGDFAIRLGNTGILKTKVAVTIGLFHSISFGIARTCAQTQQYINVSVSSKYSNKNTWGLLPVHTMYSCNGWESFSWGFMAESDEVEIAFHHLQKHMEEDCGPTIDLVALKAFPSATLTTDIVKNGNFEDGPYFVANTSSGVLIPPYIQDHHSPLLGWTVESLRSVRYIDSDHFSVPAGKRAVELIAGRESVIAQTVNTIPEQVYNLAFFLGDAGNNCEGSMVVEVDFGKSKFQIRYDSAGDGRSELVKLRVTAETPRTRVKFISLYYLRTTGSGNLCGPVLDDVSLSY